MSVRIVTKGRSGKCASKAFAHGPIEMRHERNHHVGLRFPPVLFEKLYGRAMVSPDHRLQDAHELRAAEGPACAQHLVVEVLDADVGVFLEDIELVEQFLEVRQPNFPGLLRQPGWPFQGLWLPRGGRRLRRRKQTRFAPFAAHSGTARAEECYRSVKNVKFVTN